MNIDPGNIWTNINEIFHSEALSQPRGDALSNTHSSIVQSTSQGVLRANQLTDLWCTDACTALPGYLRKEVHKYNMTQ